MNYIEVLSKKKLKGNELKNFLKFKEYIIN